MVRERGKLKVNHCYLLIEFIPWWLLEFKDNFSRRFDYLFILRVLRNYHTKSFITPPLKITTHSSFNYLPLQNYENKF